MRVRQVTCSKHVVRIDLTPEEAMQLNRELEDNRGSAVLMRLYGLLPQDFVLERLAKENEKVG